MNLKEETVIIEDIFREPEMWSFYFENNELTLLLRDTLFEAGNSINFNRFNIAATRSKRQRLLNKNVRECRVWVPYLRAYIFHEYSYDCVQEIVGKENPKDTECYKILSGLLKDVYFAIRKSNYNKKFKLII